MAESTFDFDNLKEKRKAGSIKIIKYYMYRGSTVYRHSTFHSFKRASDIDSESKSYMYRALSVHTAKIACKTPRLLPEPEPKPEELQTQTQSLEQQQMK